MPELPEVETTRRGIAPYLEGQRVSRVIVRERRLRWPIPEDLDVRLSGLEQRSPKRLLLSAHSHSAPDGWTSSSIGQPSTDPFPSRARSRLPA